MLNGVTTTPPLQVLFITPEKLAASDRLKSILDGLNQRGLLARVVVDEAHCGERGQAPSGQCTCPDPEGGWIDWLIGWCRCRGSALDACEYCARRVALT